MVLSGNSKGGLYSSVLYGGLALLSGNSFVLYWSCMLYDGYMMLYDGYMMAI